MHMSTLIIKLMHVLIIYLISAYVHDFVFKTYTPLSTFYVFLYSSFHDLIIHYTNLYCCHVTKVKKYQE